MLGIGFTVICLLKAYIILIRNKNNIDTESNSDDSAIMRERRKRMMIHPKKVHVQGCRNKGGTGARAPPPPNILSI